MNTLALGLKMNSLALGLSIDFFIESDAFSVGSLALSSTGVAASRLLLGGLTVDEVVVAVLLPDWLTGLATGVFGTCGGG